MKIGFIEDTHLRGGTQIWVTEANRFFLEQGEETAILAPGGSFVAEECQKAGAQAGRRHYRSVMWSSAQFTHPGTLSIVRSLLVNVSKKTNLIQF